MEKKLILTNSLTRKKETFEPLNPPFVGMYVCGPTVYGDPHLGHARPAVTFDVLFRYLKYQGFKVRYVRNITDVGHLEDELAGTGEDKIAKKARLEQLEPMEISQHYTNTYHDALRLLNCLPPSIEPLATGHIPEQINMISEILEKGYAYEVNGNVYFDVVKYSKNHDYGKLSGKVLEDLLGGTRDLEGQEEKRNNVDFALWKKASPEHIMKWESPWSVGFPGWHLECSVMSSKYLGAPFDIHGGGMDLMFPHHECEIAQSKASNGEAPCRYWIHNNLITINNQKMSKSLNNFITLEELFAGTHEKLDKGYSPMTMRFFILQAHYRSTLDFSNEALFAAEKGYGRLMQGIAILNGIKPDNNTDSAKWVDEWINECHGLLSDDLNTARLIAGLFDGLKKVNAIKEGSIKISGEDLKKFSGAFNEFVFDILGLEPEISEGNDSRLKGVMELLLEIRLDAREKKDFATSDKIRDQLLELGFVIKDSKEGTEWH